MEKFVIMTDGGASSNPGRAACAYLIKSESKGLICIHGEYVGETTNNVAEYIAVVKALEYAKHELHEGVFSLLSDSKLIVEQLCGNYTVKSSNLLKLWKRAKRLVEELSVEVKWIPRQENKLADWLVSTVRSGKNG